MEIMIKLFMPDKNNLVLVLVGEFFCCPP